MVGFPTSLNRNTFVLTMVIMYVLFILDAVNIFSDKAYNIVLFGNDFTVAGHMAWFINAVEIEVFIFVLSRAACILIHNQLIKSVFFAIMIDSVCTFLGALFLGYYEHMAAIIVRNIFVVLAFLCAYVILFKPYNNDTN